MDSELKAANPASSRLVAFLNTPLGLYLLSGLLIGALSFSYTRWNEHRTARNKISETADMMRSEIAFRVRQFDTAMQAAREETDYWLSQPLRPRVQQEAEGRIAEQLSLSRGVEPLSAEARRDAQAYRITLERIAACVRMGGISFVPGDLKGLEFVRFQDLEIETRMLPYGQGYKFPEYMFFNLSELSSRVSYLTANTRPSQDVMSQFRSNAAKLNNPALLLFRMALRSSGSDATSAMDLLDASSLAKKVNPTLKEIENAWEKLKKEQPLVIVDLNAF